MPTLSLLLLLASACHGVTQGMAMSKLSDVRHVNPLEPGARGHQWFRWYHLLLSLLLALVAVIGHLALSRLDRWPELLALAVTGWRVVELMYAQTRYARWLPDSENLLGLGVRIYPLAIVMLHGAAVVAALTLVLR